METTALIPARGGSKSVVGKNLRLVGGVPLVSRAVAACSAVADRVLVSTDDEQIAAAATLSGAEIHLREGHLASDEATVDEVAADIYDGSPLIVYQPTIPEVESDLLAAWVEGIREHHPDRTAASVATVPARHIMWRGDECLSSRENRQTQEIALSREIGLRYYPTGWDGTFAAYSLGDEVTDIDTPLDLVEVRHVFNRRSVLFYIVASQRLGMGHLRRCLSIAEELQHHDIRFRLSGESEAWARTVIEDHGFPMDDLYLTNPDFVVVDALDTDADRFGFYPKHRRLHLEDLTTDAETINTLYDPAHLKYAVIRPEFHAAPPYAPSGEDRILVTFGGTDPSRLTEMMDERLVGHNVMVIPPPAREGFIAGDSEIWGGSVAEAMAWADVIVTSGGRTVLEAMATETPVVAVCQNIRETRHAHLTLGNGVLNCGLGWDGGAERALERVMSLTDSRLLELSAAMAGKVDGLGALRLARLIEDRLPA